MYNKSGYSELFLVIKSVFFAVVKNGTFSGEEKAKKQQQVKQEKED